MEEFLLYVQSRITIISVIEVIIIAYGAYRLLMWIRGTQAEQVFKGLIFLFFLAPICSWLGFTTLNMLITGMFTWAFIFIIIVFQQEFRTALGELGKTRIFSELLKKNVVDFLEEDVDKITKAIEKLSSECIGALVVLEKENRLNDIAKTGTALDSDISKELLENIFTPNRPLHDGAVIIKLWTRRIAVAGCLLPLSDNYDLSSELGTRHRAGLGMTEKSDALVIIVSEETAQISYASGGTLFRDISIEGLKQVVLDNFVVGEASDSPKGSWIKKLWERLNGK